MGRLLAVLAGAALLAIAGVIAVVALSGGSSEPEVHRFVVPVGTGERLDAGEAVEIIPRRLEVDAGDQLVVVNQDDRAHVVGPFAVRAGETLEHTFTQPGRYVGECSVHPDGRIEIVVT